MSDKQCTCLKESEETLFTRMKENLSSEGKLLKANPDSSHYVNTVFCFDHGFARRPFMEYEFSYIPKKKDGSPGNKKTVKQVVTTSFCPFCGEKYPETTKPAQP
jgi:hypothetical protein